MSNEPIADEQLKAWRALCDAVGPGPWRVSKEMSKGGRRDLFVSFDGRVVDSVKRRFFPSLHVVPPGCHGGRIVINEAAPQTMEGCDALADFLAESRVAVPALLDEVARLRALCGVR
jgi:hypothetical protein